MPKLEILFLILLSLLAWLWSDGMKTKEAAIRAVRKACEAEGLQLLDDTIELTRLKPARNDHGRIVLARIYQFEYSDTGDNRRLGSVHLLGARVTMLNIGLRLAALDGRLL